MTLEEAKQFYRHYNGQGFFMAREEPARAAEYRSLGVTEEMKRQWDGELIGEMFRDLWKDPSRVW